MAKLTSTVFVDFSAYYINICFKDVFSKT